MYINNPVLIIKWSYYSAPYTCLETKRTYGNAWVGSTGVLFRRCYCPEHSLVKLSTINI